MCTTRVSRGKTQQYHPPPFSTLSTIAVLHTSGPVELMGMGELCNFWKVIQLYPNQGEGGGGQTIATKIFLYSSSPVLRARLCKVVRVNLTNDFRLRTTVLFCVLEFMKITELMQNIWYEEIIIQIFRYFSFLHLKGVTFVFDHHLIRCLKIKIKVICSPN